MQSSRTANEIDLPDELGSCPRRFRGRSELLVYLIASDSTYSPEAQSAVLEVLKYLDSARPIERLFRNFDASEKHGHIPIIKEEEEADLDAYKSIAGERTKDLTMAYLEENWVDACWAFGMITSHPVHVQAFDDWYSWAVCKDALRLMDQRAGKVEVVASVLQEFLIEELSGPLPFDELLRLARLEWDDAVWARHEQWLDSPDFKHAVSGLGKQVEAAAGAINQLAAQVELACDFYKASRVRVQTLVRKSLRKMLESGSKTCGLVVGLPWLSYAADLLEREQVSLLMIVPQGVSVTSIIEGARKLVKDPGAADPLSEVLLALKVRSPVEAMMEGPEKLLESRATSWATAAEGILWLNESNPDREQLQQAEKCLTKSLELWPEYPVGWATKGMLLFLKGDKIGGVECFDEALSLEPRNFNLMLNACVRCIKSGLHEQAEKYGFRGLYLNPKHGLLWNNLGASYQYRGRLGAARYCIQKAAQLRDEHGIDNLRKMGRGRFTFLYCPPKLTPPVVFLMNKIVLPLKHIGSRKKS